MIIWDVQFKLFTKELPNGYMIDTDGLIKIYNKDGNHVEADSLIHFNYIGKIDVDKKKIHADCSIVEIGFSWQKPEERIKGFFQYDKASLGYVIWDLTKKDFIDFDLTKMQYFKIIDTIQENRFGLMDK